MRHRFHALCPYFAMFPETFAEEWIARLSKPGETVLDPFCGRGTTPFQALLMGRRALACDINPVAFCITRAKTNAPPLASARRRITRLRNEYEPSVWEAERRRLPVFFRHAYAAETLRQVLFLRSRLKWWDSDSDCMLAGLVLGALHGESHRSKYYLSNRMPRTISTKPAYSVRYWKRNGQRPPKRDAFELLRARLDYRYRSRPPSGRAAVFRIDMRDLPRTVSQLGENPRCVVTSPPYFDTTSFEEDQWLRLWFLGGPPHPTYGRISRDDRHENPGMYWNMIADMWRVLGSVLGKKAHVVVRLGGRKLNPGQVAARLRGTSVFSGRKVSLAQKPQVSELRDKQTAAFRPGAEGCKLEVDCHFLVA